MFWDAAGKLKGWPYLNQYLKDEFPNVLDVMDLLLCILPSSAEPERVFSRVNLTKRKHSSCLKSSTLNARLGIYYHTEEIGEWDPSGK